MNGYKLVTNVSTLFYFEFRTKKALCFSGKKAAKAACRLGFRRFCISAEAPVEKFRKLANKK
jgi:hypothetical protein